MSLMMGWDGHAVHSCSPMDSQLGHRASVPVPARGKNWSRKSIAVTRSCKSQVNQFWLSAPNYILIYQDSCCWGLTPPKYCTCSHPALGVSIFCTTNCPILSRYRNNVNFCACCAACPYPSQKNAWLGTLASVPPQTVSLLIEPPGRSTLWIWALLGVVSCYDATLSVALPPFVPPPVRPKDRPPMEGNPRKLLDCQKRKALLFNQGLSC